MLNPLDYPHVNVEETFDEIVREYGGAIILREKIDKSPDFANADYVFHFEKVIAELKCLMDDNIESPAVQAKINATIDRHHAAGTIKTKEINEETWPGLPVALQNEIYNATTHSIRARVRKANRQIRETKYRLGLQSYHGLLIIANDGLLSMPPAAFTHAVLRSVMNDSSEISCFISLTANVFALVKGVPMPVAAWIPLHMGKPFKVDVGLLERLRVSWINLSSKKMGVLPVPHRMTDQDMEAFWKARNLPRQSV